MGVKSTALFRRVHAVLIGTLAASLVAVFVSGSARANCSGTMTVACSGLTSGPVNVGVPPNPVTINFSSDFVADGSPGNVFSIQINTNGAAVLNFAPGASTGPITAQGPVARTFNATFFNATLPSGASFGAFDIRSASRVNINIGGTSDAILASQSLAGSLVTVSGTVNNSFGTSSQPAILLNRGDVLINPGGRINATNSSAAAITISNGGTVTNAGTVNGQVMIGGSGRVELRPGGVFNGTVRNSHGTFVLGGDGADTFNLAEIGSKYQGFSSFGKEGTSTWTVTGTSAAPWTVSGGTMLVAAGANLGDVTVNGGTLGGNGTIGSTTINSGGTLAPGSSIGTITSGNLVFNSGSNYHVEATQGAADRTNVIGTASLTGGTVQLTALAPLKAQTFTILNATDGLNYTTFAGVTATNALVRNPQLTYDDNNVYLTVDTTKLSVPAGASNNGANVVAVINNAILGGVTLPSGFNTLFDLNGSALSNALDQLSGEGGHGATVTAAFAAAGQFLNTIMDPSLAGRGGGMEGPIGYADEPRDALAYAGKRSAAERDAYRVVMSHHGRAPRDDGPDARWSLWASGYGGSASVEGNAAAGTHTTTNSIYGTAVGADYRVGPGTMIGFAMGGAGTNFSTAQGLGGGHADLFQVAIYGRHYVGPVYIAGALSYGWQGVTIDRTVTVAGTDQLRADFSAHTFAARAETGYRLAARDTGLTPYAAAQFTSVHLPSYAETAVSGSNQFALSFSSDTTSNLRTELGVRTDRSFVMQGGTLTLRGRVAWAHDSNTNRAITPAFQAVSGLAFTVNGAEPAADGLLLSAGAEMKWWNGWSLAGAFEGEFSRTTESYAGKGIVRRTW